MDINAIYDQMTAAWHDGEDATACEYASDLRASLAQGGLLPERDNALYWIDWIADYYIRKPHLARTPDPQDEPCAWCGDTPTVATSGAGERLCAQHAAEDQRDNGRVSFDDENRPL